MVRVAALAALMLATLVSAACSGDPGRTAAPGTSPATSSTTAARSARMLIAKPRPVDTWPGLNGLSGVEGDPIFDTAHVEQFCTARGRECRIAQTYTDRTSYASMTSGTSWTFEFFADFDGTLIISQGLVPDGGEADLADCATGQYDQQWRDFGNLMVAHGRGDSVVRLGWEMNESTMAWRGSDPAAYIGCYRHAAENIRATNPAVLLDWSINGHGTPAALCGGRSTNCYPGDAYVDIIGIDNYDHYPSATSKALFDRIASRPEGLSWLDAFARAHGKPFSVGEWGLAGSDNPDFIGWMHEWFAAHAPDLAYEAYFSNCETGGVQSSLFRTDAGCTRNPNSATAYRELFGTGESAQPTVASPSADVPPSR